MTSFLHAMEGYSAPILLHCTVLYWKVNVNLLHCNVGKLKGPAWTLP